MTRTVILKPSFTLFGLLLLALLFFTTTPALSEDIESINPPSPFSGTVQKTQYNAESYDWETMTIEFNLPHILLHPVEINARRGKPTNVDPELAKEVDALLQLGVNYIDISYNTARMAAEIPFKGRTVDKALANKIVRHLLKLRDLCS